MARKLRLTRELIQAICERIRVGVYPYVAAAACGVAKSTYFRWVQEAEEDGAPSLFRELKDKVEEAQGLARSNAEVRVFRDKPYEWLRTGSGRDGWTESQTLNIQATVAHGDIDYREIPKLNLAEALAHFEQLGFIQLTPTGRQLLEAAQSSGDIADDDILDADDLCGGSLSMDAR